MGKLKADFPLLYLGEFQKRVDFRAVLWYLLCSQIKEKEENPLYIDLYKDRMHPAELFGKQVLYNEQPIAAKRLAASFYIVPDVLQNMPCPYTGDNPRNVQAKKSVPASSSK